MGAKQYHYSYFDKTKPKPKWLVIQGLRSTASWKYWIRIWDAQPIWANVETIKKYYKKAADLRKEGFNVVVDHVYPLRGEDICGLHVPENLQIITRKYNSQLSNHEWPGQPNEQLDMFEIPNFLKYGLDNVK